MRLKTRHLRWLLAVGLLVALALLDGTPPRHAAAAEEAKPEKKDEGEAKKGEGEPRKAEGEGKDAAKTPPPKLDPPLDGHFDRSTLRAVHRLADCRVPLKGIHQTIQHVNEKTSENETWQVSVECVIEFGTPSGVSEVSTNEQAMQTDICEVIQGFKFRELTTVAGKLRLKLAIVAALNRRLKTARVRQAYLTAFVIDRLS